jgi:hypothetical protein
VHAPSSELGEIVVDDLANVFVARTAKQLALGILGLAAANRRSR